MKLKYVICFAFVQIGLLSGCMLKTRSEISESEDKRTQQNQITSMQQQKADEEARIQDYEASLRQLNGRVEALEHRMNLDLENRQKEGSGSAQTQKQMIDQMKLFEESLAKIDARLSDLESRKPVAVPIAGTKGGAVGKKEADTSSFMDAEQLMQQKEWKRAILSYQKYREENPKGKMYADATYKIGACFQELGKKEDAKAFFEEVVEKSPKSDAARKATYRLKTLK